MLIYTGDATVDLIPTISFLTYNTSKVTKALTWGSEVTVTIVLVAVVIIRCGAPFSTSVFLCTPIVRLVEIDEGKHAAIPTAGAN